MCVCVFVRLWFYTVWFCRGRAYVHLPGYLCKWRVCSSLGGLVVFVVSHGNWSLFVQVKNHLFSQTLVEQRRVHCFNNIEKAQGSMLVTLQSQSVCFK